MIALCVRLAYIGIQGWVDGRLRATATFGAENTRPSGTVVHRSDVDAIVSRDQSVQPRRENGKVCAQDRKLHGYASV
jgi:hypothetical protein